MCWDTHTPDDPQVGSPLCPDCFDCEAAVLWNAHCSELWRRTLIRITRELARLLGRTTKRVRSQVRVQYVKVAEYQQRGLLHFHLAVRLDAATRTLDEDGNDVHGFAPPPEDYTVDLLIQAVRAAAARVEVPYPAPTLGGEAGQGLACQAGPSGTLDARPPRNGDPLGAPGTRNPLALASRSHQPPDPPIPLPTLRLEPRPGLTAARWGDQVHVEPIPADDLTAAAEGLRERGEIAGYLAKYATKHTEAFGGLDRRVTLDALPRLPVRPHVGRFVATALLLAAHYPRRLNGRPMRLGRWAHQLGYGGHFLTKSRSWSTTFGALRQVRKDWQAAHNPDPDHQPAEGEMPIGQWQMAGVGYRLTADALLAQTVRNDAQAAREAAREQRAERELAEALAA